MAESRISAYEAMFVASQSEAADFSGLIDHINTLLERAGAELVAMQKWDERRLAFEIDKQRRAVFILTYFRAPTESIARLERDVRISERLLRALVVRADHLTEEEMLAFDAREELKTEAKLRAERAAKEAEAEQSKVQVLSAEEAARAKAEQQAADEPEAADRADEHGDQDGSEEVEASAEKA
ncbi:MAG: 30S ribosomal protein S6 [Phycisphaerales bacterium]|nr:MAG: 30S ribosomal protein S6 [Phycisphaerales bacterium]